MGVKFIQKEGKDNFDPAYLFDEGSTSSWATTSRSSRWTASSTICRNSSTSSPTCPTRRRSSTVLTQQMIKMGDSPGSDNGTGFFQTLASLKIREFYEKLSGVEVEVEAPAKVAA